jgi:hypothetical protein
MSPTTTITPTDLTLTSRNLDVDRTAVNSRWWHGGDPVATAYFNALSATFPQGETFFIESVRRFREQADATLRAQIATFVQQEAMHTREHLAFNRLIKNAGYDTARMEAYTRRRIDIARSKHPVVQLAITVALEHFTAIMAHALLCESHPLPGAPRDVVKLWQWHAVEEIEHKGVAYDTYLAATAGISALRRWAVRCQVMTIMSFQFWRSICKHMADFFRQDRMNTPRTWMRVLHFLLVRPGMVRKIFVPYLSFYSLRFHPWRHDDRMLIAAVEQQLVAAAAGT